jgi:GNAT superfamily N-acetyltransferase
VAVLRVSTEPADFDVALVHSFLSQQSRWARDIPRAVLERAMRHSLCFGGFLEMRQVAFARVITDRATFANLVDVFVVDECRGRGFARQLMQAVVSHPELQGLRRFTLATSDSHGLYSQFGFATLQQPETFMERYDPAVYCADSR